MSGRARSLAVALAVITMAAACSSSAPPSASPTVGVVLPNGTYTATIPPGVNAAPGEWKLTITATGMTYTHPEGHRFSPGAIEEISANEVVFAPDPQCPVPQGTATTGRYGWSAEGSSLRFAAISDSCQDRIDTLTSSEWSLGE